MYGQIQHCCIVNNTCARNSSGPFAEARRMWTGRGGYCGSKEWAALLPTSIASYSVVVTMETRSQCGGFVTILRLAGMERPRRGEDPEAASLVILTARRLPSL